MHKKNFYPGDTIIYLIVTMFALVSLVFVFQPSENDDIRTVVVICGETVSVYPLSQNQTVTLEYQNGTLTFVIESETVSVIHSDCPDGLCVEMGPISRTGQAIACLPAQILISIERGTSDADIILG